MHDTRGRAGARHGLWSAEAGRNVVNLHTRIMAQLPNGRASLRKPTPNDWLDADGRKPAAAVNLRVGVRFPPAQEHILALDLRP